MASAQSNTSVGSSAFVDIFDADSDGGPCSTYYVAVRADSTYGATFRSPDLGHPTDDGIHLDAGESMSLRAGDKGLFKVQAKGDGDSASITGGKQAIT